MNLITFASFKGGAGKTTVLMALTSSLIRKDMTVALLEADENRPLTEWKQNAIQQDAWSEHCDVFLADTETAFENAYNKCEEAGYDIALIDTHGGGSDLNSMIMVNSDFIVIPSSLSLLAVDATMATFEYAMKLFMNEGMNIPAIVLRNEIPTSGLTKAQQRCAELLDQFPGFTQPIHKRDAFEAIKFRGLLHKTAEQLEQNPATRMMARNYHTAISEADQLADDILHAIREKQ